MSEKIIRDPVHDVISFRLDRPLDALLFKLINAAEFQRLRRIRQLGMASLAYPGADHSRYSHSIGVMETARRMLEQLALSVAIPEADATVCLVAALLHDLGHGPLSHVFERVSNVEHEKLTLRIVEDPDSTVYRTLLEHDAALPAMVAGFFRCHPNRTFLCDVISSQLDADRFDYLLRDNLMTGSQYGGYDLRWLLHSLTVAPDASRLAVTLKGVSAVEAYLQSRYHMYRNVYFHKVVRTAEGMVELALLRAKRLAVQDRLPWPHRDDGAFKALLGRQLSLDEFTALDDVSLLYCLKVWMSAQDAVLARLCHGLLYRELYKTIDLTHIDDPKQVDLARNLAREAIASASGDPGYELFYDEPSETPYEIYDGTGSSGEIPVRDSQGNLKSFAQISPITQALNRQLMFRRLHVSALHLPAVEAALAGIT